MTQDWSNDAENLALITEINYILQYIHIENSYFEIVKICSNITALTIFGQINAGLVSRRDFFKNISNKNNRSNPAVSASIRGK